MAKRKTKIMDNGDEACVKFSENDSLKIVCCDCELVHRVSIMPVFGGVKLKFWRDNRSTALRRRHRIKRDLNIVLRGAIETF